ncbi:hypothetical protein C8R45DRAFT_1024942 [Mycena sanguinolenta]|nr:hypothetical protein C8R45DRAFT_1024942 [Mycena sanguinolenta]
MKATTGPVLCFIARLTFPALTWQCSGRSSSVPGFRYRGGTMLSTRHMSFSCFCTLPRDVKKNHRARGPRVD